MINLKNDYKIISNAQTGIFKEAIDYHVTFRLNDKCNMSCEYCRWYDGENYRNPLETVDALFNFFIKQNFKTVLFYFHGGEPGIHPQVIETLEHLRKWEQETKIKVIIEFQTNLSYGTKKLSKIIKLIDNLSISYHYIDLYKINAHLQFVKNFCFLKLKKYKIRRFDVMLENVQDLDDFYKKVLWFLKYKGIQDSEMIHSFCHYDKNPDTKTKHLEFYNKYNKTEQKFLIDNIEYNTNDLFAQGLNCEGCLCDAGSKDIVINCDGNVFTCGIEMTYYRMQCVPVKPIVNVLTDKNYLTILNIKLKTKTKCKYNYCGGDFYIQKYGVNNDK